VKGQHHAPTASKPREDPVPIVQEAEWASGPVWTVAENPAPPLEFDPRTVQPLRSHYTELSYRGPTAVTISCFKIFIDIKAFPLKIPV